MESNRDEALRCLAIAQKHRDAKNYPSARKFAQKSIVRTQPYTDGLRGLNEVLESILYPGSQQAAGDNRQGRVPTILGCWRERLHVVC
jgi:hypothetical protein